MKKFLYLVFAILICIFVVRDVQASSPSYDVLSYRGTLTLNTWDDATYEEELVYYFKNSYNGQYVTLGSAGNMPQGFEIEMPPKVEVEGRELDREPEITNLGDGYRVKIYNSGVAHDTVKVKVTWNLKNLLFVHQDILRLNWKPISDGDRGVSKVELKVIPKFASPTTTSELHVHTAYLGPEAVVTKDQADYTATISNLPRKEGVELSAYWLKSDLASLGESSRNTGLMKEDEYHRLEEHIAQTRLWIHLFGNLILPAIILLFLLLAIYYWRKFKKATWSGVTYPTDTRMYELPNNLAPLVMASVVYSTEIDEACPAGNPDSKSTFSFDKLLQATLLDLMDRGAIAYRQDGEKTILSRQNQDSLDDFERDFLNMAFGNKLECTVEHLFEDFYIDPSLYKHAKKKDQDRIRAEGREAQIQINCAVNAVARGVQNKIQSIGFPTYYRPLSPQENTLGRRAITYGIVACIIAFLTFFARDEIFHSFSIYYMPATVALGVIPILLSKRYKVAQRDGVVNAAGAEQRYYWDSFGRMLKEIAHLNDAELQSLVLWNRLLVYAALYGVADKVAKVMKLRQIHIQNPALDAFVYTSFYHHLSHSSNAMSNYSTTATTASHFTVSSSSGGGFSGGGGGGGFGAF